MEFFQFRIHSRLRRIVIGFVLLGTFNYCPTIALAASSGPNTPGTVTDNGGSYPWTNPSSASVENGSYARSSSAFMQWSNSLLSTGYGFAIPEGSTVTGIKVEAYNRLVSNIGASAMNAQIVKNGSISSTTVIGNNTIGNYPNFLYQTAGGDGELWGETWTATDINAANFGVAIKYQLFSDRVDVDNIKITVYYTVPSTPPTVTLSERTYSCSGTCPPDWESCGYAKQVSGGTYDVGIAFSEAVTGFTSGDVSVTNGSVTALTGGPTSYTATVTSSCDNCVVSVSVGSSVAQSVSSGTNNTAGGPIEIPWGKDYWQFCDVDCSMFPDIFPCVLNVYWPLNESSGTTGKDVVFQTYVDKVFPSNATVHGSPSWGQCPATTEALNTKALLFNGTTDYLSSHVNLMGGIQHYAVSLWVKSNTSSPTAQTLLQIDNDMGKALLTLMYRSDKTNFLHLSTESAAAVSNTAFDITQWNHIVAVVDTSGNITSLRVNGVDVKQSDSTYVTTDGVSAPGTNVHVGGRLTTGGAITDYFSGFMDEVFMTADETTVTDIVTMTSRTKNGSCTTSPPTASSFTPPDNATSISTTTSLILQFDQTVVKGSGNIYVKKSSDNTTVQTIAVTAGTVALGTTATTNDTATITINALDASTGYYVTVAAGAFVNATGGSFAGIAGGTTWNFTTGGGVGNGTLFRITGLPSTAIATYAVKKIDDNTDAYAVGLPSGTYTVRLTMDGTPVVDAPVGLTQNRSWRTVSAETDAIHNKAVIKFLGDNTGTSGTHTLYVVKGSTTSFRVCPNAQILSEVTSSCTGGVAFTGSYPQTQTVGADTVEVGTTSIGGLTYWYASGLTGSGGEGEGGGGGDPVPFFPWWSVPGIAIACGYVLYREKWVEM